MNVANLGFSDVSLEEFMYNFPDDRSCLDWLVRHRFGGVCPQCVGRLYRINGRKSYTCSDSHQFSPTAATIFHKSKTPLHSWFYAVYLISRHGSTVTAISLSRQLGVSYKTAWRMQNLIREQLEPGRRGRMVARVGVYPTGNGHYRSRTRVGEKTLSLGTFNNQDEARAAYRQAKALLKTRGRFRV